MTLRTVAHNSEDYLAAVQLRREVLRYPLGIDFTQDQLDAEHDSIHVIGEVEGKIVATLIVTPVSDEVVKIRQVAVDGSRQGLGLGKSAMLFGEDWARAAGYKKVELHARRVVEEFYLRIGYAMVGEPFEEVGIPHIKMVKPLV